MPNNIQFIFPLCISKLSGKKKGLTAWENVDSLDFFKTSLFWSKKILSIQNIQKQSLLDYLPKTQKWKKVQFFDKNNGLISSENFDSWTFLKLHFQFWSKKRCFWSRLSKNDISRLDLPQKTVDKKIRFFDKKHGLSLWENFNSLDFFKTLLFSFKKRSFLSKTSKNDLFWCNLICPKNTVEKSSNFWQKQWTSPLGKFHFLGFF